MRFFSLFSRRGSPTPTSIGPEAGGDADPGRPGNLRRRTLLQAVEANGLYVRSILVTHAHNAHINGHPRVLRVYDAARSTPTSPACLISRPTASRTGTSSPSAGSPSASSKRRGTPSIRSASCWVTCCSRGTRSRAGGIGTTRGRLCPRAASGVRPQEAALPGRRGSRLSRPRPPVQRGNREAVQPLLGEKL